jgi:hypothetical protein
MYLLAVFQWARIVQSLLMFFICGLSSLGTLLISGFSRRIQTLLICIFFLHELYLVEHNLCLFIFSSFMSPPQRTAFREVLFQMWQPI